MKKWISVLVVLGIILSFAACQKKADTEKNGYAKDENGNVDIGSGTLLKDDSEGEITIDPAVIKRYIVDVDTCMIGLSELVFDDPSALTQAQMLDFFRYAKIEENWLENPTQSDEDAGVSWYDTGRGEYIIPPADVNATLDKYFEKHPQFTGEGLEGYDSEAGDIRLSAFSTYGGNRNIKILEQSEKDGVVTVKVEVYGFDDDEFERPWYTKTFTLKKDGDIYRFLSVKKEM